MNRGQEITADVVIVGSGVAGALAAYKLAKSGVRNVLLLEAGPRVSRDEVIKKFKASSLVDNQSGFPNAASAPRPDWNESKNPYIQMVGPVSPFTIEYLRVVGGTTWHWGGCTPRMRPSDFSLFSAHGVGVDWPFGYETLEPYYTEAEEEIGVAGDTDDGSPRSKPYPLPPIPFSYCDKTIAEGVKDIGISFITRPAARASLPYRGRNQCQGFGTCCPICPSGAQYSAIYHVERAEKLGVRVLDNTRVDRLVSDGAVTRLEARDSDGTLVTVRSKIFVLAANGIETPRLLLMSANENLSRGVANSSGCVGRNFMEHPTLSCLLKMPKPVYAGRGPISVVWSSTYRDGDFRKERPSSAITIEHRPRFQEAALSLLDKGMEPPELDAAIKKLNCSLVELFIFSEQLPDPHNGITLDWNKRDSAGQPTIRLSYSFNDYDKAGFTFARKTFDNIARVLGAGIFSINGPFPQQHLMGTTRMGNDPKASVTDSFGRSHDHKNLFILGSSLFPSGSAANPTLTIAALALRTADEIARQLKA